MKRTLTAVGLAAIVLLGTPRVAGAETATGGTPRTSEGPNLDGAGTETSSADADGETGSLRARAEAVGGNSLLPRAIRGFLPPNIIPGQGPSTAAANAGVSRAFAVEPGTYAVTITYADAAEVETGSGAAYVQSSAAAVGELEPAIAFDELPVAPGTVTRTFTVEVEPGEDELVVMGTAVVIASADGAGKTSTAEATVGTTTFTVDPV